MTAAKNTNSDLIVMASHVSGLKDQIFSSNAGYVASRAQMSVYGVRQPCPAPSLCQINSLRRTRPSGRQKMKSRVARRLYCTIAGGLRATSGFSHQTPAFNAPAIVTHSR